MPLRIDHARIFDEDIRNQQQNQNHDHARLRIEIRQDRRACKQSRDNIEHYDRPLMPELHLEHQHMMQMAAVRFHDLLSLQLSAENGNQRIADRNEQHENRQTKRDQCRRLEA